MSSIDDRHAAVRPASAGLLALALLLALPVVSAGQDLRDRRALGDRVTLLVPADFTVMSDELRAAKYPSGNRPDVVFTNDKTTVNVSLRHAPNRLPPDALDQARQSVEGAFKTAYPSAAWFRSSLVTINGRQWFLVDVRTPAVDTEIRNIIVGTSLDDRMLLVSFNAVKALEDAWLASGNRIIQSIVVK
jgi:hypothetical protein